jgi:methylase of polypeptide subunit release factors
MDKKYPAIRALGRALRSEGYRFTVVTPETHRRVLERPRGTTNLQSIFGWNLPFDRDAVAPHILDLLATAEALEEADGHYRSKLRFATLDSLLFVHSGFPTTEQDSVFFGPDTYRFARLLRSSLRDVSANGPLRLVDIGSGSGAGGIYASRLLPGITDLILADINPKALEFSAVNAALNDVPSAQTMLSDVFGAIEGQADLVIANPPYLVDAERRLYRDGGGALGITLALRIVEQGLTRIRPGGRLILYTGTPIIAGADPFLEAVRPLVQLAGLQFVYEEIDPDVFGEELDGQAYAHADRIAVTGLTVIKRVNQ